MGRMVFCTVALLGAVAGAAVVTAMSISRRKGTPFVEALYEVPAEVKRRLDDLAAGVREAAEAGRKAAAAKEEEIDRALRGEQPPIGFEPSV